MCSVWVSLVLHHMNPSILVHHAHNVTVQWGLQMYPGKCYATPCHHVKVFFSWTSPTSMQEREVLHFTNTRQIVLTALIHFRSPLWPKMWRDPRAVSFLPNTNKCCVRLLLHIGWARRREGRDHQPPLLDPCGSLMQRHFSHANDNRITNRL